MIRVFFLAEAQFEFFPLSSSFPSDRTYRFQQSGLGLADMAVFNENDLFGSGDA